MAEMRNKIKTVLDIEDDQQDDVLDIFITNAKKHLLGLFRKVNKEITEIPEECDYIIEEITIRRFNRIGSEGFKSELVEGHRIDFYDLRDEFDPYLDIIDSYKPDDHNTGRGKVIMI